MNAVQTIDPAIVWELVKEFATWLAAVGIVIDLTPGLKFQPVRWLLSRLGNLINADMKKQLDTLQRDFEEFKIESWRTEILEFSESCMNRRRHTKEQFDHIIEILGKYDRYIKENQLTNGQVDVAHEYILEVYKQCIRENDFALDRDEEEARKAEAIRAREARNRG